MSNAPLQVARWSEVYETSESRKHKTLSWLSLPIGLSSNGYQDLVDEFGAEAPAIYGAWCALIQVAAQAPTRGVLATSKAVPYSARKIARLAYMDAPEVFERLIAWASSEAVGWLEVAERQGDDASVTGQRHVGDKSATRLPNLTEPNLTRPNPTDRTEPDPPVGRSAGGRSVVTDEDWEAARPRANAIADRCSPNRKLTQRDRADAVLWASLAVLKPEFGAVLDDVLDELRNRNRTGKPPDHPFAYLKTALTNELKRRHGWNYHEVAAAIEIPERILKPKTESAA